MIEEEWRYYAPEGAIFPGGPSDWYILDWDQRRTIAVTMDEEQRSPDVAIGHLKKHIDALGPDVYAVHFSQDGELISVSTKPEDDQATCVYYPPLQDVQSQPCQNCAPFRSGRIKSIWPKCRPRFLFAQRRYN